VEVLAIDSEVAVATVTATGAVIVAALGVVSVLVGKSVGKLRGEVRETAATVGRVRHHVENDHGDRNLREELDEREVMRAMRSTQRDVGGLRQDVRQLRSDDQALDQRMQRVESTVIRISKETP
jgi:hypothetical protein